MNARLTQFGWVNIGAIATVVLALLYLFLWPGPEGLPMVKIGIPARTIQVQATILGINDLEAAGTFQPGKAMAISVDNAPLTPVILESVETLPDSTWATLPDGSIQAQPDPRPETEYSRNVLLTMEGQGYQNRRGSFLGLKRVRVGSSIRVNGFEFDTQASVVAVNAMER